MKTKQIQFFLVVLFLVFRADIRLQAQEADTNTANQDINIQALFNSQNMTYLHRDELQITVTADRDCFFKIIHIDANNQMRMIYPNSSDTDNNLKANTPRAIFETAKYYLYDPYGEEVILVAASSQQFANIEKDYISPWVLPATTDNIRAAVRTGRGGELEAERTAEGEARYTITVLKPHEEFTYGRPEDMREMYLSIQDDVLKQGGSFFGGEQSAFYTVNGIRGSYRIPRDTPDTIQFAIYNLNELSRGSRARVPRAGRRTRGAGFNFNIERPGDITQTIQTVRSAIEGSGGTFTGNERQGNFQAKGITGQYRVADLVNVTITDKPFVIPNSLIEKEVKSYFTGR